jgi:hypothetical protein
VEKELCPQNKKTKKYDMYLKRKKENQKNMHKKERCDM